jgi:hypothetical protein
MRTLLAYAFDAPAHADRVTGGLQRVEDRYRPWWAKRVVRSDAHSGHAGLHVWDARNAPARWPAWAASGQEIVASLYVPLGWTSLVGFGAEDAPLPLVRQLLQHPERVYELTPPFVLAHLDERRDAITFITDMLGVGRLFELRCADGWVWSNRPVAALAFAGTGAKPSRDGWRYLAACDWAMGDTTAYEGVQAVPPATQVRVDRGRRSTSSLDVCSMLCKRQDDTSMDDELDRAAAALLGTAKSVSSVWSARPTLSLSGGRDSRLVVASFVAADVDVSLVTDGTVAGEADTAAALVAALPRPLEHTITTPADRATQPATSHVGAIERARRWHDFSEGMHPAQYLDRVAPMTLAIRSEPIVSGSAGEVAHAYYYPSDIDRLAGLALPRRLDAYVSSLTARVTLPRGLSQVARDAVEQHVQAVVDDAAARGVDSPVVLDWFYVAERLRRWGVTGARFGKVLPLLTPHFVRAGFAQTTAQRKDTALHQALITRLVPQWKDVPFFRASLSQRQAVMMRRLGDDPERDVITTILNDGGAWADAFDMAALRNAWDRSVNGQTGQREEHLLQRAIWRAVFDDHLAVVNGEPAPHRLPTRIVKHTRASRDAFRVARRLATWANDTRFGPRLARTSAGRAVRRWLGV